MLSATKKDHFPLPFIDQILDRLVGSSYFCFLDGYSGYNQIAIHPDDHKKTMFTCPFGSFAFRRMPFGLCNAPATFQRCMMAIFSDFLGDSLEVFMDDFSIFGNDFESCLAHLTKILEVCVWKQLVLSWEKSHFMVQEGVVLGYIISGKGLEVDKAKIEVSRACRLLLKIYTRLCQSFQATHHPYLQRQRLHHRRRRETRIHNVK